MIPSLLYRGRYLCPEFPDRSNIPVTSWSQVNDSNRKCFQSTKLEGIDLRAGYYRIPGGIPHIGKWCPI